MASWSDVNQLLTFLSLFVLVLQSSVAVLEGVNVTQTNLSFFRQQLTRIATHILRCTGNVVFICAKWFYLTQFIWPGLWMSVLLSLIAVFFPPPPADNTFGPQLLQMCNQGLFECLALNLYCLRGEQSALTSVINHRIVSTHTHTHTQCSLWHDIQPPTPCLFLLSRLSRCLSDDF